MREKYIQRKLKTRALDLYRYCVFLEEKGVPVEGNQAYLQAKKKQKSIILFEIDGIWFKQFRAMEQYTGISESFKIYLKKREIFQKQNQRLGPYQHFNMDLNFNFNAANFLSLMRPIPEHRFH